MRGVCKNAVIYYFAGDDLLPRFDGRLAEDCVRSALERFILAVISRELQSHARLIVWIFVGVI